MEVAKSYQAELPRLKKNVRNSCDYFKQNVIRFNRFRRFVFDTSLSDSDKMVLDALNKPQIEFNILEAYISRLRGEFAKQEPSIKIMADDGVRVDPKVLDVVEAHMRHIFHDANRDGFEYNVYTDLLSGGFSVARVWTEYAHSMSMNQVIRVGRVYDPCLCGFDPMARLPHKGDGRYAFELYPKTKEEFEHEYPNVDINQISFRREMEGFNWSYNNNKDDILLICDYYEKKKKRKKIVQLVNGHVMTVDDYKDFLERWNAAGYIEQPPAVMGKPRWTEIETICRYRFIENKVIEYIETDYDCLPLVFVDGNSIMIRNGVDGDIQQMTRPYVYHAEGVQRLKNFAGQTLANELENMVQHKFKVAKEALPDEKEYLTAYQNVQLASTLVYKAYKDNDPNIPIPNPVSEIVRPPMPPEISAAFAMTDQITQAILGSYDAALGINENELSGTAIMEGATQSNAAAMPYVVGFLQSIGQMANMIVKLIPKYYVTPRTIPVVNKDGSRGYQKINQQDGVQMHYDENALQVKVEPGVNFNVQKSRALQQIILMCQASPIFAQFINAKGLKVILDNFEVRGADQLKEMADQYMQELAQQQQQQQKMQEYQIQNNPAMVHAKNEQVKMQLDQQQTEVENQLEAAKIAIDKQQADTDFLKVLGDMRNAKSQMLVQADKAEAEKVRAAVDLAIKKADMHHSHEIDERKLEHEKAKLNKGT